MLGIVFGRLGEVVVFGISIRAYDVSSSYRYLEVEGGTIDEVLEICVRIQSYWLLFVKVVVACVVDALAIIFRGLVAVCSVVTQFMMTVFSNSSYMIQINSSTALIIRYGPN